MPPGVARAPTGFISSMKVRPRLRDRRWGVQAVGLCVNESSAIDVQRVSQIDASGSAASVTRNLPCPSGKQVIGGGADTLNAPAGRVLLRRITPRADLLSVDITYGESAFGTTNNWSLVSYGLCATP